MGGRGAALAVLFVIGGTSGSIGDESMKTVEVVMYVGDELRAKGGVVFVMPKKLARQAFLDRYRDEIERSKAAGASGGEPGSGLRFDAELNATVSFVQFDVPEGDYEYKFLPSADDHGREVAVREMLLSYGGSGYTDPATGLPVDNDPMITHYIAGERVSADLARALAGEGPSFTIAPDQCRSGRNTRICDGSPQDIEAAIAFVNAVDAKN